tara:strand:+ start:51699 stop:52694 length:996 start_codon:yes stop_codon:yes gene_type:complete
MPKQPVNEQVADSWGRFTGKVDSFVEYLPILGIALCVIVAFSLLASLVRRWDGPFRVFSASTLLRAVLRNIAATILVLTGIFIALDLLDATKIVGAVLGAAGVLGLALGFAFKDIVENYLASILLAVRRPFRARDHVIIGGHEGKVMSLTLRETVLMTLSGNHLSLPNGAVFKSVITNFTRNPRRRFEFGVGAGTNEDLTAAQELGVATLTAMKGVSDDPGPFSRVDELGDSSVTLRFFGWVDQREHDFMRVRSEAIRKVKIAFDNAEIEMPEPMYRVALIQGTAPAADAGMAKQSKPAVSRDLDTSRDDDIDRQIAADRHDDGENLLTAE